MTIPPQYRMYASFFLFALTSGAMMARLPDLKAQLQVSNSQLGLTLIAMSIGSLISLTLSSPLIERLGVRNTALITTLGTALCFGLVPWMPNAPSVFCVLFVAGLLGGALEINLNVETDRIEGMTGKRFMNRAHGFWSLGFFSTALLAASVRHFGLPPAGHLAITSGFALIVGGTLLYGLVPAPARPTAHTGATPRIAVPTLGLLPLCLIGIAAFLVEGAGVDWSSIYMAQVFQSEPFIGGLGLALFGGFMALLRLTIDPVLHRFGPRHVATALLSIAALGVLLVSAAQAEWMALCGFALMGIGSSAVYPLAVSAAAQRTDRPAALNVAAIGQVSFVVFFLAPPLLGFVADHLGIRNSYLITLPVLALGLVMMRSLPRTSSAEPDIAGIEPATPHG